MKVWRVNLQNYRGEQDFELYHRKENALNRMHEIYLDNYYQDEFEGDWHDTFSFFDAGYNEYSTYISIEEIELESLFCDTPA